MIFHSRILENKVQSYITIPFYERVYCVSVAMVVSVLSHYLVLGREDAGFRPASIIERKETLILKDRPLRGASGFD